MKKILSLTLILALIASLAACSKKADKDTAADSSVSSDITTDSSIESSVEDVEEFEEDISGDEDEAKKEETQSQAKPDTTQKPSEQSKPQQNGQTSQDNQTSSSDVPTPSQPESDSSTVGKALLSSFKSLVNSNSSMSAEAIANKLLENPVIEFSGTAMSVEEGYLSGFDNAEIKGFKEGVMFAPMIGSIAFVGYVFTTDDASSANTLASTLKANANLRWNICVEADEMICETVGNKVFFVMCPKSFEE